MQRIVLQKGQRFGRLEVDSFVGVSAHGKSLYRCVCDCGEETIAIVSELKNGHKKSCGCLFVEMRAEGAGPKTHGLSRTVEHIAWKNMRQRCLNPKHPKYSDYGGRGITVCIRWNMFENFLEDMGDKPPEGYEQGGHALSVDRIENSGNYEPGNCKWSTQVEQNNNRRRRRWHKRPKN